MKVLLVLSLAIIAVTNAVPMGTEVAEEEDLKSAQGDSDFNAGMELARSRFRVTNYDGVNSHFRYHMTEIAADAVRKYGTNNWSMLSKHFRYHLQKDYPGKSWTCLAAKTMAYSARGYTKMFRMDIDNVEVFCQQH